MGRKSALLLFLSIPIASSGLTIGLRYGWEHWGPGRAAFVYPSSINLGARDRGEIVISRFEVRNTGGGDLLVDDLMTSCSCAGVEQEVDGRFLRVMSLRIPPGMRKELVLRIAVGAPVGESQSVQLLFHSNDPAHSNGQIDVTIPLVTGGVFAIPRAVVFGSLRVGERVKRVVDLYDAGTPGHQIATVRSSQEDRFKVRLLALPAQEKGKPHGLGQTPLAQLEVIPRTDRSGRLEGDIQIYLAGAKGCPDRVPVTGTVVSAAQLWPSTVVLPRRIGHRTVYNGELIVQSWGGAPLSVKLLSVPPHLEAHVLGVPGHEDRRLIVVAAEPDRRTNRPVSEAQIRLGIRAGEAEETSVEIPVIVLAEASP
jgi:hypothetical protein